MSGWCVASIWTANPRGRFNSYTTQKHPTDRGCQKMASYECVETGNSLCNEHSPFVGKGQPKRYNQGLTNQVQFNLYHLQSTRKWYCAFLRGVFEQDAAIFLLQYHFIFLFTKKIF